MSTDRDLEGEPGPAGEPAAPDPGPAGDPAAPGPAPAEEPQAPVAAPLATVYDPHLASSAPEHDWSVAARMLFAVLRPPGTPGMAMSEVDRERLALDGLHDHAQPLLDSGPADLIVAYVIRTDGFDILVNADHLVSWGVDPDAVRGAAYDNLRAWSSSAPWTEEMAGSRRLLASDSGAGCDAARILLPEVLGHLASELGRDARVLVGVPDRDLLVAGSLHDDDPDFAVQFSAFVGDLEAGADEPIDGRAFELVGTELRPFEPASA